MTSAIIMRQLYSYVEQPHFYSDEHHPDRVNTPDGPISIAFTKSSRRSIHTNNDPVRGVVHVQARLPIKRVTIKFIGRTTCRIQDERNPTLQYLSQVDLFCHGKTLSKAHTPSATCPPQRVEYPFEFRFPEATECQPPLQNQAPFKPDELFEHENGHPLPPSFWWNESTIRNEYFLEAEFVTEQTSFTLNPVVVHQLRFSPSVPELSVAQTSPLWPAPPIRFERISRPSTPDVSQDRRGPLTRIKTGLRSRDRSEEPSSTSLIVLSVPPTYRVGSANNVKLSLQATITEGQSSLAPIYLRGIRAQVVARIVYRIPHSSMPDQEIRRQAEEKFDLFNMRYSRPGMMIGDNTMLDGLGINAIVPPTFKSYSIALQYDVRYDLLLECGGKESHHEISMGNVVIEPKTRPGGHLGPPEEPPPPRASSNDVALDSLMRNFSDSAHTAERPPAYSG